MYSYFKIIYWNTYLSCLISDRYQTYLCIYQAYIRYISGVSKANWIHYLRHASDILKVYLGYISSISGTSRAYHRPISRGGGTPVPPWVSPWTSVPLDKYPPTSVPKTTVPLDKCPPGHLSTMDICPPDNSPPRTSVSPKTTIPRHLSPKTFPPLHLPSPSPPILRQSAFNSAWTLWSRATTKIKLVKGQ